MELLAQQHGLSLVHVPYKGSAPAIADLIAGHVPVMFDNLFASIQNIRAGKIRAIAVGSARAMDSLPSVPSFAESGMKGFEVATWIVLAAPARTPEPVITMLAREAQAIFAQPEVRQRLLDQAPFPSPCPRNTPSSLCKAKFENGPRWLSGRAYSAWTDPPATSGLGVEPCDLAQRKPKGIGDQGAASPLGRLRIALLKRLHQRPPGLERLTATLPRR